ncbi:MAG: DUF2235 domain-containing protein [Methylococcales bacterium]
MKNIILCADGTGNKGGYGADTNVYKVYKAVNIKNAKDKYGDKVEQITFYDQGVGTSESGGDSNKYFIALAEAFGFGFGFGTNVRQLYAFLARNYEEGDSIYLFGFSRGAATVRAVTGFIDACGLIDKTPFDDLSNGFNEKNFWIKVNEAFDCYKSYDKQQQGAFKKGADTIKKTEDGDLKIKFIGVWDTVSALGFPHNTIVSRLYDPMHDFIERSVTGESTEEFNSRKKLERLGGSLLGKVFDCLSYRFYNYKLTSGIENAYHALSIDDERKTFKPLVWDEKDFKGDDVKQVWFAGVHSNVGGGYPRTGMSDVALQWMMTKAEALGLVFYDDQKTAIKESTNVHDKLYDSRDGVALYYRYGPRNLQELCHGKLKGKITLHDSVYEKITRNSSDPYTPDGLPMVFNIVNTGETKETPVTVSNEGSWGFEDEEMKATIMYRKTLYVTFVGLTIVMLLFSGKFWMYPEWLGEQPSCITHPYLAHIVDFLNYLTPVYFENFITYVVCVNPWSLIMLLSPLLVMYVLRNQFTKELDDICRKKNALYTETPIAENLENVTR